MELGGLELNNEFELMPNNDIHLQQFRNPERYFNPDDISVPPGYQIEVFAQGLDTPIGLVFTENGDMLIADSGSASGNPKIIRLSNDNFEVVAEGFNVPITGVNYRNGDIYVSHKGVITVIKSNGTRQDIISGLPSYGDYSNNQVTFGQDGKIYFGQGTATNSGVVGLDNDWIPEHPYFRDSPGNYIMLNGLNFQTKNILIPADKTAYTGAFSQFGIPNRQLYEVVKGEIRASGSVLQANLDGSDLRLIAWGFRNPVQMKFDQFNRLFISNQGFDNRGSRPIANASDEFHLLAPGTWYGWPDYTEGEAVTQPRYTPEGGNQPELLLASLPSVPLRPFAVFPPSSHVMGFDFNTNPDFGVVGDVYIAEYGSIQYDPSSGIIHSNAGHRVTKIDMNTGQITTFAINKTGFPAFTTMGGGFGSPTDIVFGPDGAMYITDYTSTLLESPEIFLPNTGVIWKISRT